MKSAAPNEETAEDKAAATTAAKKEEATKAAEYMLRLFLQLIAISQFNVLLFVILMLDAFKTRPVCVHNPTFVLHELNTGFTSKLYLNYYCKTHPV